jgi:hypothetical protein
VGAKIKAAGPSPLLHFLYTYIYLIIGKINARVLPLPVSDIPITSRPLIIAGNA